MRQPVFWRAQTAPSTGTSFTSLQGGHNGFTTIEAEGSAPWSVAGTFQKLYVTLATAPGAGKSLTFTVRKNGVDSALAVTISGTNTAGSDLTNTVSVTPGDLLTLKCVGSGTPTVSKVQVGVDFESTNAKESGYGGATNSGLSVSRANCFLWADNYDSGGGLGVRVAVIAAPGDLTAYHVTSNVAPGAGKSWIFTLVKNGVSQDGTGGTVNTVASLADANTTTSWAGTLPLAAGDKLEILAVPVSSPATVTVGFGARFLATVDDVSLIGRAYPSEQPTTGSGAVAYGTLHTQLHGTDGLDTVEANQLVTVGEGGFSISNLYVYANGNPGAGTSWTFTVRKNSASTALAATIADAATSGTDLVDSVTVATGDALAMQIQNSSTPASRLHNWGLAVNGAVAAAVTRAWGFVGAVNGMGFTG
jgi:hypothetical protein